MNTKLRGFLRNWHRYFGLIGGLWIIVLGFTGLMLDHRDDWGWAWRVKVPQIMMPDHTYEVLKKRHITLAQTNPGNSDNWIVGGPTGIWQSFDNAESWESIHFEGLNVSPMVFSILLDSAQGWEKIWLATDDGIWKVTPNGENTKAARVGLAGRYLTALDNGAEPGSLVAIENRSTILLWSEEKPDQVEEISTEKTKVTGLPEEVSWSRFIFDTHLGRSFMQRSWNMTMNDIGAIAMILMTLTGFYQWYFRKRWKADRGPSKETKRKVFKYLYNFHGPTFGILVIFPLLYLSLTGIVFDHREDIMMPLVRNKVDRDLLPDVYDFNTLHKEISHVIAYPDNKDKFTVGTRLGVLTTENAGVDWERETGTPISPGFVWSLKRHGEDLFLGGLGGPSFSRPLHGTNWSMIPGLMGMPSDAAISDDLWHIISGPNMFVGDIDSGVATSPFNVPIEPNIPFMLLMFELHNGKIIAPAMKWVLDLMAIFMIFMTITGPIIWWRRKWVR